MKRQFSYVFLKYVHSLRLNESINIGMLFLFPDQDRIIFKFPSKLKRLGSFYNDFDEEIVKDNFRLVAEKVNSIDNGGKVFREKFTQQSLKDFIYNDVLIDDQSALQVSDEKIGIAYHSDVEKMASDIFESYFVYYIDHVTIAELVPKDDSDSENTTDNILAERFEGLLVAKNENVLAKISKKVPYISVSTDTSIVFDYKWVNGIDNLIKTISLDLRTKHQIEQKALAFRGKVHVLEFDKVLRESAMLNLIVAGPQNLKLDKSYHSALAILQNSTANIRIVSENELPSYSDEVFKYLS